MTLLPSTTLSLHNTPSNECAKRPTDFILDAILQMGSVTLISFGMKKKKLARVHSTLFLFWCECMIFSKYNQYKTYKLF